MSVNQSSSGTNVVSVSKWTQEGEGTVLGRPIREWEEAGGAKLTSCAVFDSRKGLVFAVLKDRRRYVTLQVSDERREKLVHENGRLLQLNNTVFSILVVPGVAAEDDGDVIVVVSSTGELALLCATGHDGEIESRTLDSLLVDTVIAVSRSEDGCIFIAGTMKSKVVVFPVFVRGGKSFAEMSLQRYAPIQLPPAQKSHLPRGGSQGGSIVDVLCDDLYMVILYTDGIVHLLRPLSSTFQSTSKSERLAAWYEGRDTTSSDPVMSLLERVFRLSSSITEDEASSALSPMQPKNNHVSNLVRLDSNYFAIGYGRCVSIWDWAYHIGHGLVETDGSIHFLCPSRRQTNIMIGCASGMQELSVAEAEQSISFSLGLAVSRKGTCDFIETELYRAPDFVPMRAQPVTVSVTKLAAEAEGNASQLFRKKLESLDTQELQLANQVLNRLETNSPESILKLTKRFTVAHKRIRRGNRGKRSNLGLSELPSERLAAATVARCLYEIHLGNPAFAVSLIDMIGTGVVSSEAVLAVLGTSDSWVGADEGQALTLLSIVDPLLKSDLYANALEAVVTRVADLPEPDVVRTVQYAVRSTQAEFLEFGSASTIPDSDDGSRKVEKLSRMTKLLLKCVSSAVDRGRVIASLRQIPILDVIGILSRLDHILNGTGVDKNAKDDPPSGAKRVSGVSKPFAQFNRQEIASYRGIGNWMDNDDKRGRHLCKSGIEGCIEWSSHLIDAHLATLIMDESGREVASRLHNTVRRRRKELESVRGLHGLTTHLLEGKGVPSQTDPLYSIKTLNVPAYASLQ